MTRTTSIRRGAALLALAATVTGCGGNSVVGFVDPDADLPYYEHVGIIPFTSLAPDRLAGEKVANVFFTELLAKEFARVVDPSQFNAAIFRVRGGTPAQNPWSTADLQRLGEETGVVGIFLGTVREYEMVRVGRSSFPLVSIEVRLVDVATGRIVWSTSASRRGGPAWPLMGWTEIHTLGELSAVLCHQTLETLE